MIGQVDRLARARLLACALLALLVLPGAASARSTGAIGLDTVAGTLAIIWGDPPPGSGRRAIQDALIVAPDGRVHAIDAARSAPLALAPAPVLNGRRVLAEGRIGFDGALVVHALWPDPRPHPTASSGNQRPPVLGHQQWASILCRFGDTPELTPQPVEYIQQLMNGPEPGIDHYWREVSNGLIDVTGSTVHGWYTLPQPRAAYITQTDTGPIIEYQRITEDCASLADAEVDFTQYAGINLMFNDELDGYARGGTYYLQFDGADRSFGVTWIPPWGYMTQYVTAHEMGHAFGLPHSSGPYDATYDSMWDVMSLGGTCNPYHPQFGCIGAHTIAYHKDWLGWLPDERIMRFEAPQDATITLERSALPSDNDAYLLAIVPIQSTTTRFYTIEVRHFVGYDRYTPGEAVVIHQVDEGRFDRPAQVVDPDHNGDPNDAGAMWLPGETFRDALNDITIRVDVATATGFVVTVHAGDAFTRTWARTDRPIVEQVANRTWMWGPESFSGTIREPYLEAPGSVRYVRYFDKSRMEITDPDADPASIWYVTNGLLVVELTTGRLQLGDTTFEQRAPAAVNVAGDADDPSGPTYATFGELRHAPPLPDDAPVIQRVDRAGHVSDDPSLATRNVVAAHRVQVPGIDHQVASPFWEFMNSSGVIWVDGYGTAPLFQDPFYATGLPISEAYWAWVKVGGVYQDVLIQCFERRCLTYTPDNPPGWQVEAGNVGLHYYAWRYPPIEIEGQIAFAASPHGDVDIFLLRAGVDRPIPVITDPTNEHEPALSPDGTRVAFTRFEHDTMSLWIANVDRTDQRRLTFDIDVRAPAWSPDGARIAFEGWVDFEPPDIWVIDVAGGNLLRLTDNPQYDQTPAWSPDGTRIVYARESGASSHLYIMDADGTDPRQLTFGGPPALAPSWSPDGATIVYAQVGFQSDIMAIDAAGGEPWVVVASPMYESEPSWSPDGTLIVFVGDTIGSSDLFVVKRDGSGLRNISNSPDFESSPSWSRLP